MVANTECKKKYLHGVPHDRHLLFRVNVDRQRDRIRNAAFVLPFMAPRIGYVGVDAVFQQVPFQNAHMAGRDPEHRLEGHAADVEVPVEVVVRRRSFAG